MLEFFLSDNGQQSQSRLLMFVIVVWKLAEGTMLMVYSMYQLLPVSISDIPLQWAGVVGLLYGLNKFGTKDPAGPPPTPPGDAAQN